MRSNNTTIISVLVFIAGLLLTFFALFFNNSLNGGSQGMMGGSNNSNYPLANMLMAIIGSFLMAAGVFVALLRQDYEPLIDVAPIPPPIIVQPKEETKQEHGASASPVVEPEPPDQTGGEIDDRRLVLRLLTGDERTVFRAIVDSGGEALQKDLIIKTKMSDAKISRTLDKLVEKGVVSKTRFGMTNKVKVEIEP